MKADEILALRGRDWVNFSPRRKKVFVERAFVHWRHSGFPHYALDREQVKREYRSLALQPAIPIHRGGIGGSSTGLRLANFFQPQMWSVRVSRYISPYDVFSDDAMLRRAIERSWTIWPDRFGANAATLRRMLKTFPGVASVSNFRPTLARGVIEHYCKENEAVLDFSAGYGGRLLGALVAGRRYIGIEPCRAQIRGLGQMRVALKQFRPIAESEILRGCAEDILPGLPACSVGLVFSSPPYFDWERYENHHNQSFVRYDTYPAWRESFLWPTLEHSARILRPNGYLVLNVSGRNRQPSAEDAIAICRHAGLVLTGRVPLLITRVPYLHPRNAGPHKKEELLVFVKKRRHSKRATI